MELFKGWFSDHFLKHVVSAHLVLLLLDEHSSHYNPEAVRLAKENDVILFTLVPHTTHEMQPLNTAVFNPLKSNWREACHDYLQARSGKVIRKHQFSHLLLEAWMKTMLPPTIISGFRTSGVYPFNPSAVLGCYPDTDTSGTSTHPSENIPDSSPRQHTFTVEQIELFERRYKEGFNLNNDADYVSKLEIHHPEAVSLLIDCNQLDASGLVENHPEAIPSDFQLLDEAAPY